MNVSIGHGIQGATQAVKRKDAIIIVDTIRASTTYVNAFGSGVEKIVPCASREDLLIRLENTLIRLDLEKGSVRKLKVMSTVHHRRRCLL